MSEGILPTDLPVRTRQAPRNVTSTDPDLPVRPLNHGPIPTLQAQGDPSNAGSVALSDRSLDRPVLPSTTPHCDSEQPSHLVSSFVIGASGALELRRIAAEALSLVDERDRSESDQRATHDAQAGVREAPGLDVGAVPSAASFDVRLALGPNEPLPVDYPNGGYDQLGPLHYPPLPQEWRERASNPSLSAGAEDVDMTGTSSALQAPTSALPYHQSPAQSTDAQPAPHLAALQSPKPKRICSHTTAGFYPNGGYDPFGPFHFPPHPPGWLDTQDAQKIASSLKYSDHVLNHLGGMEPADIVVWRHEKPMVWAAKPQAGECYRLVSEALLEAEELADPR